MSTTKTASTPKKATTTDPTTKTSIKKGTKSPSPSKDKDPSTKKTKASKSRSPSKGKDSKTKRGSSPKKQRGSHSEKKPIERFGLNVHPKHNLSFGAIGQIRPNGISEKKKGKKDIHDVMVPYTVPEVPPLTMTEIIIANDVEIGNSSASPLVRFSDGAYGVTFDLNKEKKLKEAEEAKRLAELQALEQCNSHDVNGAVNVVNPIKKEEKKVVTGKKKKAPIKSKSVKQVPKPKGKVENKEVTKKVKETEKTTAYTTPHPIVQLYGATVRDLLKAPGYHVDNVEESIIQDEEHEDPQETAQHDEEKEEEDHNKKQEASNKLFNIGWIYYHGFANTSVSYAKSYAYFYDAARLNGNPMAHYYLGLLQLEGKGTELSYPAALENFTAAEKNGREREDESNMAVRLALYQIAKMHESGQIVRLEEKTEAEMMQTNTPSRQNQRGVSASRTASPSPQRTTSQSPQRTATNSKSVKRDGSKAPPQKEEKTEIVLDGKTFKIIKQPKNIEEAINFYLAAAEAGNKDGCRRAELLK